MNFDFKKQIINYNYHFLFLKTDYQTFTSPKTKICAGLEIAEEMSCRQRFVAMFYELSLQERLLRNRGGSPILSVKHNAFSLLKQ